MYGQYGCHFLLHYKHAIHCFPSSNFQPHQLAYPTSQKPRRQVERGTIAHLEWTNHPPPNPTNVCSPIAQHPTRHRHHNNYHRPAIPPFTLSLQPSSCPGQSQMRCSLIMQEEKGEGRRDSIKILSLCLKVETTRNGNKYVEINAIKPSQAHKCLSNSCRQNHLTWRIGRDRRRRRKVQQRKQCRRDRRGWGRPVLLQQPCWWCWWIRRRWWWCPNLQPGRCC
jgi:hypothetical protein